MIVEASHPAWIRHCPRGARTMRDSLVRTLTTVALPVGRDADVEPAGTLPSRWRRRDGKWELSHSTEPLPVFRHAGRTYLRIDQAIPNVGERPVTPGELARHIGGGHDGPLRRAVSEALLWTPFQDPVPARPPLPGSGPDARGVALDLDDQRAVEHDGRAAAAAALAAAAGRLLVTETRTFRPFEPFARCMSHGSGQGSLTLHPDRASPSSCSFLFAPERHREAAAFEGLSKAAILPEAEGAVLELLPADGGDLDVALNLARLACDAPRWLAFVERSMARTEDDAGEARALAAQAAPFAMRARTGTLADDGVAEALPVLRRCLAHVVGSGRLTGLDRVAALRGLAYAERVATPRLSHRTSLSEEDVAAMAGLAP